MPNRPHVVEVLRLIDERSYADPRAVLGLDYSQIAQLLKEVRTEKLVEEVDMELRLTEDGRSTLAAAAKWVNALDRGNWITPQLSERVPRLAVADVFLPDQIPDAKR